LKSNLLLKHIKEKFNFCKTEKGGGVFRFIYLGILLSFFQSKLFGENYCHGSFLKTSWQFSTAAKKRFHSYLGYSRNNVSISKKIKRINIRMNDGLSRPRANELAKIIALVSQCTLNDFTYLSAVFEKESTYCQDRHNEEGGDSGCGQFTSASLTELKNQLKLEGRIDEHGTAGPDMTQMISRCFNLLNSNGIKVSSNPVNRFLSLYNKPIDFIKNRLRGTSYILEDIIATSVMLKFWSSIAGGYIVPGNKKGGLALYNGGGTLGYAGIVDDIAKKVRRQCEKQNFMELATVAFKACELHSDRNNAEDCIEDFKKAIESGLVNAPIEV
jgi:hypothetical protein